METVQATLHKLAAGCRAVDSKAASCRLQGCEAADCKVTSFKVQGFEARLQGCQAARVQGYSVAAARLRVGEARHASSESASFEVAFVEGLAVLFLGSLASPIGGFGFAIIGVGGGRGVDVEGVMAFWTNV